MRYGRRLALDVGKARIGVAICDPEGILASPLEAISRSESVLDTISSIVSIINIHEVMEIYIGDPLSLSGETTASTNDARLVARELAKGAQVAVRLVDERLTTVAAASKLRAAGHNAKTSKALIDSASAVEILESALNFEKSSGSAPGELVGDPVGA
jgi:putative Holliday junction resolvase